MSRPYFSRLFSATALILAIFTITACGKDEERRRGDASCTAAPICEPGLEEVETCPAGATCVERSMCDTTILCTECPAPVCPEGSTAVTSCEGRADCTVVTSCGLDAFCNADEPTTPNPEPCTETPSCPPDRVSVANCGEEEAPACIEVTACEQTIGCRLLENECEYQAPCEADQTVVETCAEGRTCTSFEACGQTLYCQPPAAIPCDAIPTCDGDDPVVTECPTAATCYNREACDTTILCMGSEPSLCEAGYTCPEGYSGATDCEPWGGCILIDACDEIITCGGPTTSVGCRATPTCPEGWTAVEDCTNDFDVCMVAELCNTLIDCVPDALAPVCSYTCPDGHTLVADVTACTSSDQVSEPGCFYVEACNTDYYCRSNDLVDCSGTYDACPAGHSVAASCTETDGSCGLYSICEGAEFCARD